MKKEITIEMKHFKLFALLIFFLFVLALNLQVTFTSPIVFGDEGFHTYFAKKLWEEKEFFTWMPFESTNLIKGSNTRPPLWNLLEAGFFFIFGFNEIIVKFLTPFIAIFTGISIYLLIKRLFNERIGLISSIIAITIPSFVTYSVLFYTDILFTFFTSLAFLLLLIAEKESNKKYFLLSGVFAALAFLTKIPGVTFYAFYGLIVFYEMIKFKRPINTVKKYLPVIVILLLIPMGFFIRNLYYFGTPLCYQIPYIKLFDVSSCYINKFKNQYEFSGRVEQIGTESNIYQMGIINYLNFAYGPLWFIIFGFIGGIFLLLENRDKIKNYILLFLLIFFLLFIVVTGRAEDTARYTLGYVPIVALVSAIFFDKIYEFLTQLKSFWIWSSVIALWFLIFFIILPSVPRGFYIIIIISILIVLGCLTIYFLIKERYNYGIILTIVVTIFLVSSINFLGKLNTMILVKQFSHSFFEACDWVKANLPKNVSLYTVWAHRAIYNCQRNAVSTGTVPDIALSKSLNIILDASKVNGITHIFIQKFSIDPTNKHYGENYDLEFIEFLETYPEHFIKIYENGISLEECKQYWQTGNVCGGNIIYEIKW